MASRRELAKQAFDLLLEHRRAIIDCNTIPVGVGPIRCPEAQRDIEEHNSAMANLLLAIAESDDEPQLVVNDLWFIKFKADSLALSTVKIMSLTKFTVVLQIWNQCDQPIYQDPARYAISDIIFIEKYELT